MSKWGRRTQRALPIAILAIAALGAPILIFEPDGLPRMRSLQKELAETNDENAALRRHIAELRGQVKDLRDDPPRSSASRVTISGSFGRARSSSSSGNRKIAKMRA